ncbi:hypothetical protein HUT18_11310 [Streptomyces sp. NA04227]|uniref:hypothetical protein n=1 Tax=Streptomyces sp. NA04227 TaxID=2742136 RepID=UPI0015901117|nr:hypothetical protein [Streptomyces sp. NA04227]QKW06889.1 hypothetical protein HUT18_11310 [Streptomyces sp. NA04227]
MSAIPIALVLATAAATAVGTAALHSMRGLRKQVAALHEELARGTELSELAARVPQARQVSDAEQIRTAVAEALAEERERELAEARAFWAAQEARDASDSMPLLGLPADDLFLPRQSDFVGLDHLAEATVEYEEGAQGSASGTHEYAGDSPELAAARRRHPSHPDFVPAQSPVHGDHERTVAALEELAEAGIELADVRPGPLGTLDVYVFADGTTLCMTPGHRETAQQLAAALVAGEAPVLLGGSGVSGAYSLTFACGEENVYVLADRVIASA